MANMNAVGIVETAAGISFEIDETFEEDEYDTTACGVAPCVTDPSTVDGNDTNMTGRIGARNVALDAGETLPFTISDSDEIWGIGKFDYDNAFEAGENILFVESIRSRVSICASRESGTCTAIWSPSKSALKAEVTKGCSLMARPSTSTGWKAWIRADFTKR